MMLQNVEDFCTILPMTTFTPPDYPVRYYFTSAPQAYDYGYTDEVAVITHRDQPVRLVCIQEQRSHYQTDRYMSGMHFVTEVPADLVGDVETAKSVLR